MNSAVGDLPLGWPTAPRILVDTSQTLAAQKIIEQRENQTGAEPENDEQDEDIHCLACGKEMAEGEVKCRSCGWTYQGLKDPAERESENAGLSQKGPAAPQKAPDALSIPLSPKLNRRAIWGEVLAVLAIGVFPHLISSFAYLGGDSQLALRFWVESVVRCLHSACIAFAVLYLIHRSGEGWTTFGIERPLLRDIPLGLMIYLASYLVYWFASSMFTSVRESGNSSPPKTAIDHFLMLAQYSASAFAEELVTRAYLITRLEQLFCSGSKAVALSAGLFASYHGSSMTIPRFFQADVLFCRGLPSVAFATREGFPSISSPNTMQTAICLEPIANRLKMVIYRSPSPAGIAASPPSSDAHRTTPGPAPESPDHNSAACPGHSRGNFLGGRPIRMQQ
jgi:membrane protease YdiL (CAAX protease family)